MEFPHGIMVRSLRIHSYLSLSLLCLTAVVSSACERGQKEAAQSGHRSGSGSGGTDPDDDPMNATTGGNSTGGAVAGSGGSGGNQPPRLSSGCGVDAAFHGERSFDIELPGPLGQQITREYAVRAPLLTDYDPDNAYPVVFVFHGANGTNDFESMDFAADGAAGKNAIFVAPQGILLPGYEDYGLGWDENCNGYDMPFFDAMLEQVASDFCIDRSLVFAVGFSWGGDMSNSLGCCRGDVVRGVLPASGGEMLTGNTGACTDEISAFRITYADNDGAYPQEGFQEIVEFYRNAHGCSETTVPGPEPLPSNPSGQCKTYQGCEKPVIECVYPGIGHARPELWRGDVWNFISQF
jgi:polyhydroxybutyrate depolymerase